MNTTENDLYGVINEQAVEIVSLKIEVQRLNRINKELEESITKDEAAEKE